MSVEVRQPNIPVNNALIVSQRPKITKKFLDDFLKTRVNIDKMCKCPCHNFSWIRGPTITNAQMILSVLKCIECTCEPVFVNVEDFSWFQSHLRIAFRKKYPYKSYPLVLRKNIRFYWSMRAFLLKKIKK